MLLRVCGSGQNRIVNNMIGYVTLLEFLAVLRIQIILMRIRPLKKPDPDPALCKTL
jgi:hypothetical protein